jgi:hypothetical protein
MRKPAASFATSSSLWGRLAACGALPTHPFLITERRFTTGAQLGKLPHRGELVHSAKGPACLSCGASPKMFMSNAG